MLNWMTHIWGIVDFIIHSFIKWFKQSGSAFAWIASLLTTVTWGDWGILWISPWALILRKKTSIEGKSQHKWFIESCDPIKIPGYMTWVRNIRKKSETFFSHSHTHTLYMFLHTHTLYMIYYSNTIPFCAFCASLNSYGNILIIYVIYILIIFSSYTPYFVFTYNNNNNTNDFVLNSAFQDT